MEYRRYFVALKADDTGYEYKSREPSGQCILEARGQTGRVSLTAQELKGSASWKVVLVFPSGSRFVGVPIGTVYINDKGKGELKTEIPLSGIGGSFDLASFSAVALVSASGAKLSVPLSGYKDSPVLWKKDFSLQGDKPPAKAAEPAKPASKAAEPAKPIAKPIAKASEPAKPIAKASEPAKPIAKASEPAKPIAKAAEPAKPIAKASEPAKPIAKAPEPPKPAPKAPEPAKPVAKAPEPPKPVAKAPEPPKPSAKAPEPPKPSAKAPEPIAVEEKSPAPLPEEPAKPLPEIPKHVEPFTIPKGSGPTYVNKFQVYDENAPAADKPAPVKSRAALDLEEIFEGNAEMAPFEKQSNEVKWVRISIREPVALPIDYHRIFKDPFIISSYEKYNHFILGHVLDPDVDMYIIGVPCTYSQQNLTTAKNLGFTQFKCVDNVLPANGEYGYCLLCVPLEC